MEVFFNEKCLEDCVDIELTISFLHDNLTKLTSAGIRTYTHFDSLLAWKNLLIEDFDLTSKNYFYEITKLLLECQDNTTQFYYHHITHQDHSLFISPNIVPSSIVIATNKFLSGHLIGILNLPTSVFHKRPLLPILKSPYNSKEKDELANLICFDDAKKIKQFVLLHEKLKFQLEEDEFDEFSKEYFAFLDSFDFLNWAPKTNTSDGKLISESAFPASTNEFIKNKISTWKIKKNTPGENISNHKELGGIILELHGYTKNIQLTGHYKYDIYEAGKGNKKLLISIDQENGLFEVIERGGTHIGVHCYNGQQKNHYNEAEKIKTHSLHNIPEHMFIFKD